MQTIKLPDTFFRKERDTLYSNWTIEVFRELVQNSIDAGSTKVCLATYDGSMSQITISGNTIDIPNGCIAIVFSDNGCGMTREVLENIYFSLGNSTKDTDSESIGGFGRARILTNFSMKQYHIITNDMFVSGSGAQYKIEPSVEHYSGCIQVMITDEMDVEDPKYRLQQYLKQCDLNIDVENEGYLLNNCRMNCGEQHFLRDICNIEGEIVGKLYYLPEVMSFRAGVRVNGVSMFEKYAGTKKQIIIELDPRYSKTMLSASRNSFTLEYQEVFDKLLLEFANNEESQSKSGYMESTEVILGRGYFKFDDKKNESFKGMAEYKKKGHMNHVLNHIVSESIRSTAIENLSKDILAARNSYLEFRNSNKTGIFYTSVGNWIPTSVLKIKTSCPDLIRLSKYWSPGNWLLRIKENEEVEVIGEDKEKLNLLLVWTEALQYFAHLLHEEFQISPEFIPGFCLSDGIAGECSGIKDSSAKCILLNPFKRNTKIVYNTSNLSDLRSIIAIAKHEMSHVRCSSHGESFSLTQTRLDEITDQAKCIQLMKSVRI